MTVTPFARFTVLLNGSVPVVILGWDAWHGQLGANPVNFAIRTSGILSLIFLILALLVTPISRIIHWSSLTQLRRMFGLYAFFHASLHFLIFFGFDREASAISTLSEISLRPYLMVGTLGLVLMLPLALTSTNGMIRRLGGKRWKALHRLTYIVAVAGVLHYYMLVKADITQPIAFAVALAILLSYRLVTRLALAYQQRNAAPTATITSSLGPTLKPRFWSGQLEVTRIVDETPSVRTFRLESIAGNRLPFDFLPGQYLNLSLVVDGKKIVRSYTIASSPTCTAYCELTVKREPDGVSSRYLHDAVTKGCILDVSAPAGRFTFTGAEASSIVMIAGGVGITPLMAKIRYLTELRWTGDIDLIFAVKTRQDIIFRHELDDLSRRFPNLRVTITLTREDNSSWSGHRGRISPDLLNRLIPRISTKLVHICASDEMTASIVEMLQALDVPANQIKLESFTPVSRSPTPALEPSVAAQQSVPVTVIPTELTAPSVHFARSGKSKLVSALETVLEASEDLGLNIAYDCRAGFCGQCKTRLLSGQVVMDAQYALSPVDLVDNMILACQARCIDQVVVDF